MKRFAGFGFGAIQSGLFLFEARRSGNFGPLTVAEVDAAAVRAVRENGGRYTVNVAGPRGITTHMIDGVQMLNPRDAADRAALVRALADADEVATALPSVAFFDVGDDAAPAALLAAGLAARAANRPLAIYTAENHNHAAEILTEKVAGRLAGGWPAGAQALNTVIGKMSNVITDEAEQRRLGLTCIAPGLPRAVLVEEFNRILISRITLVGFERGIAVFEEKADLLPFEEAKLYGHNAVHALLGYLAHERGHAHMAEAGPDAELMQVAREAFLLECGAGLCHRHAGVDLLFTPAGFQAYAEDLLVRMTNPYLSDPVARVIRDPQRKLGWDDRLIGAMRLSLAAGVTPHRLAAGARAALRCWLRDLWSADARGSRAADEVLKVLAS